MKSIIIEIAQKNYACSDAMKWLNNNKTHSDKWLYDHCNRPDWIAWWLYKSGVNLDKKTWVQLALICAEAVLQNYERQYSDDKRPRKAIEAARAWLNNPSSEAESAAWSAARSAESAAWSAESAAESAARSAAESAVESAAIRKLISWRKIVKLLKAKP